MNRPRLRTIVADTSSLVSLAVPRADADYDTDTAPDPLQYLLTSCTVSVPPEVISELQDIAQYHDIHGAAATNVLAARNHYTASTPMIGRPRPRSGQHSASMTAKPTESSSRTLLVSMGF